MFDEYANLKKRASEHLSVSIEVAQKENRKAVADALGSLKEGLNAVRYNIAIIGNMKRGKSTLINAMMGRKNDDISPVASKVCTAAITYYLDKKSYGKEAEEAVIYFEDGKSKTEPLSKISEYVTEARNPRNTKRVRKMEVYGDFPLLNESVSIVDSPGLASVNIHHDDLIEEFLPQADAIIFPIAADLPLEASEVEFLKKLSQKETEKIFFVLTKRDQIEEEDYAETVEYIQDQISEAGLVCDKLYETSAKDLFEAYQKNESEETIQRIKADCGLLELETAMEGHILENSDKNKALRRRLHSVFEEVDRLSHSLVKDCQRSLKDFTKDVYELESELKTLEEEGIALRKQSEDRIRRFKRNWQKISEKFAVRMERRSEMISDDIIDRFQAEGLKKALKNTTQLSRKVTEVVYREITEPLVYLEDKLNELVEEFQKEQTEDVHTYCKKIRPEEKIDRIAGGVALGGVGLAGGVAISQIMGAWGGVTAAYATYTAAATVAAAPAAVAAEIGVLQTAWVWLVGSGGTAITTTAATTGAAKAAAMTAMLASGGSFLAVAAIGGGGVWLASKMVKGGLEVFNENKIPGLVDETLAGILEGVQKGLDIQRDDYISMFEENLEDLIRNNEERVKQVEAAVKSNDPKLKIELKEKEIQFLELAESNQTLQLELKSI